MTPAVPFRERPEFLRGRTGERIVGTWLKQRGWYVIPSYDYSGEDGNKAPRIEGQFDALVIPDLDIARNGTRRWAEVKAKTEATFYRKEQRLEHGIDLHHYRDYRRVQDITGCHVWLFIVQEDIQIVMAESIDELEGVKRVYDGPNMGRQGMIFWPQEAFRLRVSVAAIVAAEGLAAVKREAVVRNNATKVEAHR